jgi:hypothetical protein
MGVNNSHALETCSLSLRERVRVRGLVEQGDKISLTLLEPPPLLPSPKGRGRITGRPQAGWGRGENSPALESCSLSLRERVRVRGNSRVGLQGKEKFPWVQESSFTPRF